MLSLSLSQTPPRKPLQLLHYHHLRPQLPFFFFEATLSTQVEKTQNRISPPPPRRLSTGRLNPPDHHFTASPATTTISISIPPPIAFLDQPPLRNPTFNPTRHYHHSTVTKPPIPLLDSQPPSPTFTFVRSPDPQPPAFHSPTTTQTAIIVHPPLSPKSTAITKTTTKKPHSTPSTNTMTIIQSALDHP